MRFISTISFLLIAVYAIGTHVVLVASAECSEAVIAEHLPFGFPSHENILCRTGYVASYNDERDVPNWVCYHLSATYLASGVGRTDDYRPDPDVAGVDDRAELSDYKGNGYDRGHLAPAADMSRSGITMSESFMLTNIAPQIPGFNRGIWKQLEQEIRDWARERNDVNVCTGPVYLDDNGDGIIEYDVIGRGKVAVPDAFFKIVAVREDFNVDVIAFVLRNTDYPPGTKLTGFIVSVDKVEILTGLDFLDRVDDELEEKIESIKAARLW